MKKKLGLMIASALTAVPAANITAAMCMFNTSIVRSNISLGQTQGLAGVNWSAYSDRIADMEMLLSERRTGEYNISSFDGLRLYGQYFSADGGSSAGGDGAVKRIAVCFHGYTSFGGGNNSAAAGFFLENGFDVLLPDLRAHGNSEGEYVGFGCLDRYDGLEWIKLLQNKYRKADREGRLEIYLYGVSMGGATVMMTAGEALPGNVKGVVEDCGYTTVWDIFADELDYLFHLPAFPVLTAADLVARVRAGYGFTEASALEQVAKAAVPVLFIHGSEDNFVYTDMVYDLYDACRTPKDLLVVEGAGHGESYAMDPALYFDTVFGFIEGNCIPN